jgi:RNA polymerase sigma factor (TIGR02999 family)
MANDAHEVTRLLQEWSRGNRAALDAAMPLVHAQLHAVARQYLEKERPGHTLQPSALVNEAYLRLVGERNMEWQNRAHFVAVAARLMRFILVDYCRRRHFQKRGGHRTRVALTDVPSGVAVGLDDLIALDEALGKLATFDERKCRVVELRYFGGLTVEETAQALSMSVATVMRDLRLTKAWLHRELSAAG